MCSYRRARTSEGDVTDPPKADDAVLASDHLVFIRKATDGGGSWGMDKNKIEQVAKPEAYTEGRKHENGTKRRATSRGTGEDVVTRKGQEDEGKAGMEGM